MMLESVASQYRTRAGVADPKPPKKATKKKVVEPVVEDEAPEAE